MLLHNELLFMSFIHSSSKHLQFACGASVNNTGGKMNTEYEYEYVGSNGWRRKGGFKASGVFDGTAPGEGRRVVIAEMKTSPSYSRVWVMSRGFFLEKIYPPRLCQAEQWTLCKGGLEGRSRANRRGNECSLRGLRNRGRSQEENLIPLFTCFLSPIIYYNLKSWRKWVVESVFKMRLTHKLLGNQRHYKAGFLGETSVKQENPWHRNLLESLSLNSYFSDILDSREKKHK